MTLPVPGLTHLALPPIPSVFERAVGYHGDAQFLLLYGAGDDVVVSDGQLTFDGTGSQWRCFLEHPNIMIGVYGYQFGASDEVAQDGFLLDRRTRSVYAGPLASARHIVRTQFGLDLSLEQWAAQEGITVGEADTLQQQAVASWLDSFAARDLAIAVEPREFQAAVSEGMRIEGANALLLQAALDALPPPLPSTPTIADPAQSTVHRISCALCEEHLGTVPQPFEIVADLALQHLVELHAMHSFRLGDITWHEEENGRKEWRVDDRLLIIMDPPHNWIHGTGAGRDALDTILLNAMATQCRQDYPALFDELALSVYCGVPAVAILQHIRHLAGMAHSPAENMAEYTLEYLADVRSHQTTVGLSVRS